MTLIRGRLSSPLIASSIVLLSRLQKIQKRSGTKFLCMYLKACHMLVMQYVASSHKQSFIGSTTYGPHVSLTLKGIPRILPIYLRTLISKRNPIGIRMVLSFFNLYRVLPYPGCVKLATIVDPWKGSLPKGMILFIPQFISLFLSSSFTYKWSPFPILAAGSTKLKSGMNSMSGFLIALLVLYGNQSL